MKTHPNLTSRVWAGSPSVLPCRPTVSFFTTGIPVPSICTYRIGTGFAQHHGQIQLHGSLDLFLLGCGDILADGFRRPLHGFGGHLQIGKQFHLLPSVVEGCLLADDRLHAAHPGRELRVLNVQFDIGGELAGMAVRAQVVGARHFHHAHHRQDRFGAQFPIMRRVATTTGDGPLVCRRDWELQQFGQDRCPCMVHGGAHQHLGGLQFQMSRLAAAVEESHATVGLLRA